MSADANKIEQSVGSEIIEGLEGLRDTLRDNVSLQKRFTMRTVELELEPQAFTADEVKNLRSMFNASQAVFAKLIGVKPSTLQSWEQGRTSPPPWGCRLMELMQTDPDPWKSMLEDGARSKNACG